MLSLKDPNLLRQACYINGTWTAADSGEAINVTNPATGETIATVPRCGAAETERAIAAADEALKTWRETTWPR
jgi:succinate-semialdehyde dehydrogenase/glutarate-semialdehyde dehydrogenase